MAIPPNSGVFFRENVVRSIVWLLGRLFLTEIGQKNCRVKYFHPSFYIPFLNSTEIGHIFVQAFLFTVRKGIVRAFGRFNFDRNRPKKSISIFIFDRNRAYFCALFCSL